MKRFKITKEELKEFTGTNNLFVDNKLGILKAIIMGDYDVKSNIIPDANMIGMHIRMFYFDCVEREKRNFLDMYEWNEGIYEFDYDELLNGREPYDEIYNSINDLIVLAFLKTPDPFSNDVNEHDRYFNKVEMFETYLGDLYETARKDANEKFCEYFKDKKIDVEE